MTTLTLPDPLTARIIGAVSLPLRVCETLALNHMVQTALAIEAEYAQLGSGTPPLDNTVEVAMMWSAIGEFTDEEVH